MEMTNYNINCYNYYVYIYMEKALSIMFAVNLWFLWSKSYVNKNKKFKKGYMERNIFLRRCEQLCEGNAFGRSL